MPLFRSRPGAEEVDGDNRGRTSPTTSPSRKGSIFGSKRGRSLSPTSSTTFKSRHSDSSRQKQQGSARRGGFFHRRSSSASSDDNRTYLRSPGSRNGGGFLGFGHGTGIDRDPTILAARQKVTDAEEAEKEADRALSQARNMVKEARGHVKILEQEAMEDARRAKAKQAEAKIVGKVAKGLGRHGS
ncbi:hypothetical protein LshimejAT787_0408370 [Lyophyllum shimeji]|uniref:Uncharacterized protein n=1 Tax=Lyophyllum shimeji TaxID=47721 RepID=A0A9P3PM17_LYOSH|nr:hypothetical protein LshimejAT787_0408370 [Lyophyllum shimeji]